jgi:hypothetical protein
MKAIEFSHRSGRARRVSWLVVAGLTTAALVGPGTGAASADTVWATVTGYAEGTNGNNDPESWGQDCTKLDNPKVDTYVLGADYALVIVKAGSEAANPGFVNTLFANASMGQTVWADTNGSGVYDEGDKGISHIIFCGPRETTTTTTTTETTTTETTTETTTTETTSTQTTTEPTPTPTPTPDPTPTPTPNPTPTPTPNPTPTPTPEPTPTPDATETVTSLPTGEVLSEVGGPAVTLPPTDTLPQGTAAPGGDNWRLILLGMAGILAGSLVMTPAEARARKRR